MGDDNATTLGALQGAVVALRVDVQGLQTEVRTIHSETRAINARLDSIDLNGHKEKLKSLLDKSDIIIGSATREAERQTTIRYIKSLLKRVGIIQGFRALLYGGVIVEVVRVIMERHP